MNDPDHATRRRVVTATGAALATALAGCGSPDEDDGDDGGGDAGGDEAGDSDGAAGASGGNGSDEDVPTDTEADDPYAPEGNSTRGSGNRTVSQRTPSGDATGDGGNESGSGTGGGGSGNQTRG